MKKPRNSFTATERRGLIILTGLLLLIAACAWIASGRSHSSAVIAIPVSPTATRTQPATDTISEHRDTLDQPRKQKSSSPKSRHRTPVPRRDPLSEPVPHRP